MTKYDYYLNLKEDIEEVLNYVDYEDWKSMDYDEYYSWLYDNLWIDDYVTGNGSGSYTFNTQEAMENVFNNFDLAKESYQEFGGDLAQDLIDENWEKIDVTIRCYLLGEVLAEVLEEAKSREEEKAMTLEQIAENYQNDFIKLENDQIVKGGELLEYLEKNKTVYYPETGKYALIKSHADYYDYDIKEV